jgi:ribosomal protein S18 acetylase RimI-like enzyme
MLKQTRVTRVETPADRELAIAVLRSTYEAEKGWVDSAESQLPQADLGSPCISWFVAQRGHRPAGVLRVYYEPPVAQYRAYNVTLLDQAVDVDRFLEGSRIAKIGRFAIAPRYRRNLLIAVALMRAATRETVERGFTHYITDVFENDPHSPYGFHTRVMGFAPVATHEHGEFKCRSRRITLILDLKAAYRQLKARNSWIFRSLTADWDERLHHQLAL